MTGIGLGLQCLLQCREPELKATPEHSLLGPLGLASQCQITLPQPWPPRIPCQGQPLDPRHVIITTGHDGYQGEVRRKTLQDKSQLRRPSWQAQSSLLWGVMRARSAASPCSSEGQLGEGLMGASTTAPGAPALCCKVSIQSFYQNPCLRSPCLRPPMPTQQSTDLMCSLDASSIIARLALVPGLHSSD